MSSALASYLSLLYVLAEKLDTSVGKAQAARAELDEAGRKLQTKRDQCSSLAEQLDQLQVSPGGQLLYIEAGPGITLVLKAVHASAFRYLHASNARDDAICSAAGTCSQTHPAVHACLIVT